jgi:Ca2+-binding EF-hand superfamily protein
MVQRGNGSLIGLARSFKIIDDNNSGTLDQYEFTKAINDLGVDINPKDIDSLFKSFDINGDGVINFNEFVRVVKGPLSLFRQQIVVRAFKTLDFNGDGILTISDLRDKYNSSMHPDVKSGKRTEDEVLTEFLETFELHHNILHGSQADG